MAAKRKARRKKVAPSSRGLGPREVRAESPPAAIEKLAALVESDGAAVMALDLRQARFKLVSG
jgi:hypothetical protein